ncbi:MAG TPA: GNAT family N-acetyltransferase [Acetobacteraceae bacterium]|nr:GNAT family N-acetyltransferase [Acetobacteraceae bacterium]
MSSPRAAFSLRAATEADVPDVLRLVRGLAEYERLLDRFTATEADFARVLFGPQPLARALLAEVARHPVGIAIWYYMLSTFTARPILFLEDIFVEPAHRGKGIGLALFRRLARTALDEKCWSMDWNVLNWNQPAIDFYRRIGARPVTDWTVQRLDAQGIAALAEA